MTGMCLKNTTYIYNIYEINYNRADVIFEQLFLLYYLQYPGLQVETVSRFTYLGSDIDSDGYSYPEIHRRLGIAGAWFHYSST